METFNEFDQQGTSPARNFSEIINHAFKNYFKIIGWAILLLVITIVVSLFLSYIGGLLVGYNSLEAQAEMEQIMKDGSFASGDAMQRIMEIPGYKESMIVSFVLSLLIYPLYAGFVNLMNKANTGNTVLFSDLFIGFRKNTLQYIIFGLIFGIVLGIGLMLCLLPGFFVLPLFFTGLPFILFENKSAMDAIKSSFNLAKENYGTVLGVSFITFIIALAGILFCGIGILFTLPFLYAASYSVYCAYRGVPKNVNA